MFIAPCTLYLDIALVWMERATNELLFGRHTKSQRISINHLCYGYCVLWTVHIFRKKEIKFKHQMVVEPQHKLAVVCANFPKHI